MTLDEESEQERRARRGDLLAAARVAILLALLLLCGALSYPFLASLTFALVLAIAFERPHEMLERRLGQKSLAAAASVAALAIIVAAPALFVSDRLIAEAMNGANFIQQQAASNEWRATIDAHPWMKWIDGWIEQTFDLKGLISRGASLITNWGGTFIRGSAKQAVVLLLAFYFLFFFLRDGRDALDAAKDYSPFSALETSQLFERVRDAIKATLFGTFVVACLQGALGGLAFFILGFPSPALWALIMAILSIVPVVGASLVWAPAAIYLALDDRWVAATLLAAWGALVIGTVDNLVRPLLMGDRLKLHTVPAFIAMLGGMQLFGAPGLFLGPAVFSTAALLLELRSRRQRTLE